MSRVVIDTHSLPGDGFSASLSNFLPKLQESSPPWRSQDRHGPDSSEKIREQFTWILGLYANNAGKPQSNFSKNIAPAHVAGEAWNLFSPGKNGITEAEELASLGSAIARRRETSSLQYFGALAVFNGK